MKFSEVSVWKTLSARLNMYPDYLVIWVRKKKKSLGQDCWHNSNLGCWKLQVPSVSCKTQNRNTDVLSFHNTVNVWFWFRLYRLGEDMHNVSYHIWIRKKKKNLRNLVVLLHSRQNLFFIQKLKFPELALEQCQGAFISPFAKIAGYLLNLLLSHKWVVLLICDLLFHSY